MFELLFDKLTCAFGHKPGLMFSRIDGTWIEVCVRCCTPLGPALLPHQHQHPHHVEISGNVSESITTEGNASE